MVKLDWISHVEYECFHKTLLEATDDKFTIDLSDRFGDEFYGYDPETEREWVDEKSVKGIQIDGEWVGLVDYDDQTLTNGELARCLSFILIHPNYRRKGFAQRTIQHLIDESPHAYMEVLYPCSSESKKLFYKMGFRIDELCNRTENRLYSKSQHTKLKGVS